MELKKNMTLSVVCSGGDLQRECEEKMFILIVYRSIDIIVNDL